MPEFGSILPNGTVVDRHLWAEFEDDLPGAPTVARASEGPIHAAADENTQAFRVALQAAFMLARHKLKAVIPAARGQEKRDSYNIEPALAALHKSLEQTLPYLIRKTVIAGGEAAAGVLKTAAFRAAKRGDKPQFNFEFDAKDQAAIDWADKHAAELIDGITETSREQINNAIADLLESGDWEGAVGEILDAVGDPERAARIAQHETMMAASEGQRQSWGQAVEDGTLTGNEQRTWITVGDAKVCPVCDELDGEVADIDGQYPGDGGDGPPQHVGCRCTEGLVG